MVGIIYRVHKLCEEEGGSNYAVLYYSAGYNSLAGVCQPG